MYISSDPIGLTGNNPTLYGYVQDVNTWLDPLGWSPAPNMGQSSQHGGIGHNMCIDNEIANLRQMRASNIRKNQQQVDINGNIVGTNRPDIQYDMHGVHHNIEFDTSHKSSLAHQRINPSRDPNSRNTFWEINKSGEIIGGQSMICKS